uniref:Uncharacterized protein n=1 Tax=Oryza punctata TaxID=4537 RepID=A0A0E0JL69_ORYPU
MDFAVMPFHQVSSLKCHPHARATRCFASWVRARLGLWRWRRRRVEWRWQRRRELQLGEGERVTTAAGGMATPTRSI